MQIAKELNRLVMWALKAEKERDYSEASYQCGKAFHDLAVMERNLARRQVDRLTTERIEELEVVLKAISILDYANAATNGAAYDAVHLAKQALTD